jgi:hypothetical protein
MPGMNGKVIVDNGLIKNQGKTTVDELIKELENFRGSEIYSDYELDIGPVGRSPLGRYNFSKRLNKSFGDSTKVDFNELAKVCLGRSLNSKQLNLFTEFITQGNEWNLGKKFRESPEGKAHVIKLVDAWKKFGSDIIYDYILTDEYFLYILDTDSYNKYIEMIYPGDADAYKFRDIKYYVDGVWDGQDTDLQGVGGTAKEAVDKYNDACDKYLAEGWLKEVHKWEGKSGKGKFELPPQVTSEKVISGKYDFSDRLNKAFSK